MYAVVKRNEYNSDKRAHRGAETAASDFLLHVSLPANGTAGGERCAPKILEDMAQQTFLLNWRRISGACSD